MVESYEIEELLADFQLIEAVGWLFFFQFTGSQSWEVIQTYNSLQGC